MNRLESIHYLHIYLTATKFTIMVLENILEDYPRNYGINNLIIHYMGISPDHRPKFCRTSSATVTFT